LFESFSLYQGRVRPQLELPPRRRDPNQVGKLVPLLEEQAEALARLGGELVRAGPYDDPQTREAWQADVDRVRARQEQFAEAARALREGANTPEQDEQEEREFERQYQGRANELLTRARERYRRQVQPLLGQAAAGRDPAAAARVLPELAETQRRLASLAGELARAGPYGNENVEAARGSALRQAEAWARLLELAHACLRAGAGCSADDEAALRRQEEAAERLWAK
jgi:hypothetical protein